MSIKLSHYIVVTDKVRGPRDGREKRILFGTRTGAIKIVDEKWWKNLSLGEFSSVPSFIIDELRASKIIVDFEEDELACILDENRKAITNDESLYLTVQPTAECQLDCDYCGQSHRGKKLNQQDQDRLVRRIRDKLAVGSYREFKVDWHGGEPLLAMDVIRNISPRFKAIAAEFGCSYTSNLLTNGLLLTPKLAKEFSKLHNVDQIHVTLDGTSVYHDKRRCGKNGAPSFWKIFNNIIDLTNQDNLDITLVVRCNVDHRNRDGVLPLIQLLASCGMHERIDMFYIEYVHPWGNDPNMICMNIEEFASWEIEWLTQLKHLGFKIIDIIPHRKKIVCFAVELNSGAVDAYGNLFNCTEFAYVKALEERSISKEGVEKCSNIFSTGSLTSGENRGKRNLLAKFNNRIEQGELPCSSCEILPVCGGGCPKNWHLGIESCPSDRYNISQRLIMKYYLDGFHTDSFHTAGIASPIESVLDLNYQTCLVADSMAKKRSGND